jgi:hypothetical protein
VAFFLLQFAAVSKEKDRPIGDHAMLPEQDPRDGNNTSLKVGQFFIHKIWLLYV